jgi:predicted dehydrogenase
VNAVIIATPAKTHFAIAEAALRAGKDILCEKPLAQTVAECDKLIELAAGHGRILMVGHIFLYHPCVRHLRTDIAGGLFGRIYSLDAVRTNLGPFRQDVGAIYDLASHDVSIFNHLLGGLPTTVSATGGFFLQEKHEDIGFLTLHYPNGVVCHAHTSWLNPRKVRQLTVVGDAKMAVWDDINTREPVRYYDKGVTVDHYNSFGEFQMVIRDGTITVPNIEMEEPLGIQDREFARCIKERRPPASDGRFAADVIRVLEAAGASLREGGRRMHINPKNS